MPGVEDTMAEIIQWSAELRPQAGKGGARATRRSGRVPAIIYGGEAPPVMIALEQKAIVRELTRPGFFTHLFNISAGGETHRVLARDVQLDPVSDRPIHVDFLRVGESTRVRVDVPCRFVDQDKCPGLKRGGMLNIVRHSIELMVPANHIPEQITISLAGYDVGASIHLSSISLPDDVVPEIHDRDFTIATVAAPSGMKSDADTGEAS